MVLKAKAKFSCKHQGLYRLDIPVQMARDPGWCFSVVDEITLTLDPENMRLIVDKEKKEKIQTLAARLSQKRKDR